MSKILVIGGNRFVGLRTVHHLLATPGHEVHVLNRTGQVAHAREAIVHKGDRRNFGATILDRDWDLVLDFAAFNGADVRASLEHFRRVGRYLFISTASVYDPKAGLKEDRFDPKAWTYREHPTAAERENLYQFGKRQAEALFTQQAPFPVLMIRFPFILGPDDYTHRLDFHIERVREARPIFFPNLDAQTSMIHSEHASHFLAQALTDLRLTGPLNVASPDAVTLKQMMDWIAKKEGKKPILMRKETPEIYSPYGVDQDWWLDTTRLQSFGYKIPPVKTWLPILIESLSPAGTSNVH